MARQFTHAQDSFTLARVHIYCTWFALLLEKCCNCPVITWLPLSDHLYCQLSLLPSAIGKSPYHNFTTKLFPVPMGLSLLKVCIVVEREEHFAQLMKHC